MLEQPYLLLVVATATTIAVAACAHASTSMTPCLTMTPAPPRGARVRPLALAPSSCSIGEALVELAGNARPSRPGALLKPAGELAAASMTTAPRRPRLPNRAPRARLGLRLCQAQSSRGKTSAVSPVVGGDRPTGVRSRGATGRAVECAAGHDWGR
jgi:hypothetical protein